MTRYGMEWDRRPEVIEACLTCPLADCAGGKNCERRAAVIRRLLGMGEARKPKPTGGRKGRTAKAFYSYQGRRMSLAAWAKEAGMCYGTVYWRVRRAGWDLGRALATPVGEGRGHRLRGTGKRIDVDGDARTIEEWAEALGIQGNALRSAITREGDAAEAVRRRLVRRKC